MKLKKVLRFLAKAWCTVIGGAFFVFTMAAIGEVFKEWVRKKTEDVQQVLDDIWCLFHHVPPSYCEVEDNDYKDGPGGEDGFYDREIARELDADQRESDDDLHLDGNYAEDEHYADLDGARAADTAGPVMSADQPVAAVPEEVSGDA